MAPAKSRSDSAADRRALDAPSSSMSEGAEMMEIVGFGGWPNCIRLANEQIDLVATTDVGPRVIRLGFIGGQNLFKEYSATLGRTDDTEFHPYGGHRLWHAPEAFPRSYSPDNGPVE